MSGRAAVIACLALVGCVPAAPAQQASEPKLAAVKVAPASIQSATPEEYQPFVESCKPWDDWDKPAPPFKVFRNTYHVGTCGISSILITNDEGHILIERH